MPVSDKDYAITHELIGEAVVPLAQHKRVSLGGQLPRLSALGSLVRSWLTVCRTNFGKRRWFLKGPKKMPSPPYSRIAHQSRARTNSSEAGTNTGISVP